MATHQSTAGKLDHLEGLRGIAALAVVVGHSLGAFFPHREHLERDVSSILGLAHVLYDGGFAVLIFFVLSGYVLTYRANNADGVRTLERTTIKRYPRLMLPALGSILFAYLLLANGWMYTQQVAPLTDSIWLSWFYKFPANFGEALRQGAIGAVLLGETSYNSSLWTISIEFYGALLVIGLAILFRNAGHWRLIAFVVSGVLAVWHFGTTGVYYASLIAGLILTTTQDNRTWPPVLAVAVCCVALFLGGINDGPQYAWINTLDLTVNRHEIDKATAAKSVAAILLVLAILKCGALQKILSSRICRYLGRVSFSVYLLHVPIICSAGCFAYLQAHSVMSHRAAGLLAIAISVALTMLISHVYAYFIDQGAISLASRLANTVLKRDETLTRKPA